MFETALNNLILNSSFWSFLAATASAFCAWRIIPRARLSIEVNRNHLNAYYEIRVENTGQSPFTVTDIKAKCAGALGYICCADNSNSNKSTFLSKDTHTIMPGVTELFKEPFGGYRISEVFVVAGISNKLYKRRPVND